MFAAILTYNIHTYTTPTNKISVIAIFYSPFIVYYPCVVHIACVCFYYKLCCHSLLVFYLIPQCMYNYCIGQDHINIHSKMDLSLKY